MERKIFLIATIVLFIFVIIFDLTNAHPAPKRTGPRSHSSRRRGTGCKVNSKHSYTELNEDGNKELQLLHVVFRHGERTPQNTYPTDPYINHKLEPYGWGQVTHPGKCRLYDTGKWLKTRYGKFLGSTYAAGILHAQATGIDRTHISMQTVLSGLYPPKNTAMEWNKVLNWQPIPVYSQSLEEDNLLLVRINCPRYYEALHEVFEIPEIKEKIQQSQELFKNLSEFTGEKINSAENVADIFTTLLAEKSYGLELPEWTNNYFPDKMQELTDLSFYWNLYTPELQRIKGGPFIKKMSDEWQNKRDGKLSPENRKLFIYTGHDSTIVSILAALNMWKVQFPDYGIMAIFELYKDTKTNEYELKFYQKNEGQDPILLKFPGCDESCPLEKVLKGIEPILTTPSLQTECKARDSSATTPPSRGP